MSPVSLQLPIMIIEDDRNTAALIATYLEREGFSTQTVHDGAEALARVRQQSPGFVILDVMLPQIDGWEICRELRKLSDVPILMLTAREEEIDRVLGLSLGADDYVQKPFSIQQLVLRIEAVLRRSNAGKEQLRTIRLRDIEIDTENLSGKGNGQEVTFTRREIELLSFLAQHSDRPITREELLLKVWGYARNLEIETRTVDIHIAKLRRKIEKEPGQPASLITVRGAGYRLLTEN